MNEEIAIRPMTAADLAQAAAIAAVLPEAPRWPPSAYRTAIDSASTPRRIVLVAAGVRSGPVHGFAVASLIPPQAELETIAVAARSQRQGIGRRLLIALAAELLAAGANELLLEVRASNRAAIALYRSLGFAATGHRPGYYRDPVEDAVQMRQSLG